MPGGRRGEAGGLSSSLSEPHHPNVLGKAKFIIRMELRIGDFNVLGLKAGRGEGGGVLLPRPSCVLEASVDEE